MPTISIICPVFNTSKYIEHFLESALRMDFIDFELIFIDDKSTDNSLEKLHQAALKDTRIKIIELPQNGGSGNARNVGLRNALGKYIAFADPDDIYPRDALSILYKSIVKTGADVVKGQRESFQTNSDIPIKTFNNLSCRKLESFGDFIGHTCSLFRKEILSGITYPTIKCGQDTVFLSKVYSRTQNVQLIDALVYFYRKRPESATNQKRNFSTWDSYLDMFILCMSEFNSQGRYSDAIDFFNGFSIESQAYSVPKDAQNFKDTTRRKSLKILEQLSIALAKPHTLTVKRKKIIIVKSLSKSPQKIMRYIYLAKSELKSHPKTTFFYPLAKLKLSITKRLIPFYINQTS